MRKVFNALYWRHLLKKGVRRERSGGLRCRSPQMPNPASRDIVFGIVDGLDLNTQDQDIPSAIASAHAICPSKPSDSAIAR